MTPRFHLRTIGSVELKGPNGVVAITDPRQLAVLVRLAAAPDRSLDVDSLLLTVWPHLTAARGTEALDEAAATTARLAGVPLLGRADHRWTLAATVASDFDAAAPADAGTFAAGLTLPETPEWDEWVMTARAGIAGRSPPSSRGLRIPAKVVLAAAVAAVVIGMAWPWRRPPEGFRPGDRVYLAEVEDLTSDSIGRSIRVAAAVALAESRRIELVSGERGPATASAPGGPERSASVALEAAARATIPWVVAIRVEPDGRAVVTRLLNVATGRPVVTVRRSSQTPLGVMTATAEAVDALLDRLGEPASDRRATRMLGLVTTTNVDALRAYADGSAAWSSGAYELARDYWLRAVTLDTGFAMAMGSLGRFYYYFHDRNAGERYYREALARADRLTEWERLRLETASAEWRGDRDSALALNRLLVARFPRATTYFSLGTFLLQARRCAEALEPLERSRRLEPGAVATHVNIATCHAQLGQYDEARRAYHDADEIDSTALYRGNVNVEYAGAVLHAGHPEEAESALVRMTRRPATVDRALGFRGLGFLAYWRGEVGRAGDEFHRAAGLSRQQRARNSLLRNLALAAAAERAGPHPSRLPETLRQIDSLAAIPEVSPAFLALAAEPHIDAGNATRVRELLSAARARADPRSRDDSLLIHYLAGSMQLLSGAPTAALESLNRAAGYLYPTNLALRRAQAYEQLGQLDSARAALSRILARREFGQEGLIAWTRALLDRGRVEERLGLVDQAVTSYRRFLEHWQAAPNDLPDIVLARRRLAALRDPTNR